jgi:hypothetical protein
MSKPTARMESAELLACSLAPGEMLDRIAQWKALAAEALSRRKEAGRVVSVYPRRDDIAVRLEALIDAESACCTFLAFAVRTEGDTIEAEVRFPAEFEPVVAMILP